LVRPNQTGPFGGTSSPVIPTSSIWFVHALGVAAAKPFEDTMTDSMSVVRNEGLMGHRNGATAASRSAQPIFSEHEINNREVFRAEICSINGRQVVLLARWKSTSTGLKRTGSAFEFGVHRLDAIAGLLESLRNSLEDGGSR
jgi:hypothetical protein